MGDLMEYECMDCKEVFRAKIGTGRKLAPPLLKPTSCPKCGSKNIKELRKIGYWD